jgi:hypothetical protein
MSTPAHRAVIGPLVLAAAAALTLGACSDEAPLPAEPEIIARPQFAAARADAEANQALAELRRATARYHRLDAAIADGFALLHECEERPGEGPVGIVYANFARVLDGVIDPSLPDALIYEPSRRGPPKLVGAEFAIPYPLWTEPEPPEFLGVPFGEEDEFGVWGLHIWLWRHNPEGMFAEANPRVSCDPAA